MNDIHGIVLLDRQSTIVSRDGRSATPTMGSKKEIMGIVGGDATWQCSDSICLGLINTLKKNIFVKWHSGTISFSNTGALFFNSRKRVRPSLICNNNQRQRCRWTLISVVNFFSDSNVYPLRFIERLQQLIQINYESAACEHCMCMQLCLNVSVWIIFCRHNIEVC